MRDPFDNLKWVKFAMLGGAIWMAFTHEGYTGHVGVLACNIMVAAIIFVVHWHRNNMRQDLIASQLSVNALEGQVSQSDFRSAIRRMPDGGLLVVNRRTHLIEEANTQFAKLVGYTFAAEVVGKKPHEFTFIPNEHADRMNATHEDINERAVDLRHQKGHAIKALLSVMLIDSDTALVRIREVGNVGSE